MTANDATLSNACQSLERVGAEFLTWLDDNPERVRQEKAGLTATGVADAATRAALEAIDNAKVAETVKVLKPQGARARFLALLAGLFQAFAGNGK